MHRLQCAARYIITIPGNPLHQAPLTCFSCSSSSLLFFSAAAMCASISASTCTLLRAPPPLLVQYLTASCSSACCRAVLPPGMRSSGCCSTCRYAQHASATQEFCIASHIRAKQRMYRHSQPCVSAADNAGVSCMGCRHIQQHPMHCRTHAGLANSITPTPPGRCRVQLPPAAPPAASWSAWPPTAPAWLQPLPHSSHPARAAQPAGQSGQQAARGPAAARHSNSGRHSTRRCEGTEEAQLWLNS